MSKKSLWSKFQTEHLGKNIFMATVMAVLNFIEGVAFAYLFGKMGVTVGYAIFNALSVAVAIVSGLVNGEWLSASNKAKKFLYAGLAAMILGVVIIAVGNSL